MYFEMLVLLQRQEDVEAEVEDQKLEFQKQTKSQVRSPN